ncbi:hypothetical protein ACP4OV_027282 [Aristida adscensionis]
MDSSFDGPPGRCGQEPLDPAGHTAADEEQETIVGAKTAVAAAEVEVEASASSAHVAAEAAAGDGEIDDEEWMEMTEEYLRWVLAQTRETDPVPTLDDLATRDPAKLAAISVQLGRQQALQDEFFEFLAWVRETFEKNGRVMVPADVAGPKDLLQEAINDCWDELMKEYDNAHSD